MSNKVHCTNCKYCSLPKSWLNVFCQKIIVFNEYTHTETRLDKDIENKNGECKYYEKRDKWAWEKERR